MLEIRAQQSKQSVSSAKMITIIADRESDIYEEFATVPDQKTHLLIRSRCNRHLTDGHTLYEKADETTVCGTYSLNIKTTKNRIVFRLCGKIIFTIPT